MNVRPRVELYRDGSRWRWRVRACTGEITVESNDSYAYHNYALRLAEEANPGLRIVER